MRLVKESEMSSDALAVCGAIGLGAGAIVSALLLAAGGIMCALMTIASSLPGLQEVESGAEMRIRFWYVATLVFACLFLMWGMIGIFRIGKVNKQIAALNKDQS